MHERGRRSKKYIKDSKEIARERAGLQNKEPVY
jgi:hypothetical protein